VHDVVAYCENHLVLQYTLDVEASALYVARLAYVTSLETSEGQTKQN